MFWNALNRGFFQPGEMAQNEPAKLIKRKTD